MRLLRYLWHGKAADTPQHDRLKEAGAGSALLWLLALWTGFCALALLFFEGRISDTLADGLTDHAGQRLLGAQWLGLAVVYALAALRGHGERVLRWLAAAVQTLTAVALLYTLLSGRGSADTVFVCIVSLAFALLLVAFQLAGQSAYLPPDAPEVPAQFSQPARAMPQRPASLRELPPRADPHDARTERLDPQIMPGTPVTAPEPRFGVPPDQPIGAPSAPPERPRSPDDDLLGL